MVVDGTIARVDVTDRESRPTTRWRWETTKRRSREVYPERVTVSPHKYTEGTM
jgi:hypothetical protein